MAMDRLRQAVARMSQGHTRSDDRQSTPVNTADAAPAVPASIPAQDSRPASAAASRATHPAPSTPPSAVHVEPAQSRPVPASTPGDGDSAPSNAAARPDIPDVGAGDEALDALQDIEDELADIEAEARDDVHDDLLETLQDEFASALDEMGALADFARMQDEQPIVEPISDDFDIQNDDPPSSHGMSPIDQVDDAVDRPDAPGDAAAPPERTDKVDETAAVADAADLTSMPELTDDVAPDVADDSSPGESAPDSPSTRHDDPVASEMIDPAVADEPVQAAARSEQGTAVDADPASPADAGQPDAPAELTAATDDDVDLNMEDLAGAIDDLLSMEQAAPKPRKSKPARSIGGEVPTATAGDPERNDGANDNDFVSLADQIDALLSGKGDAVDTAAASEASMSPQAPEPVVSSESTSTPDGTFEALDAVDAAPVAPRQSAAPEPEVVPAESMISIERDGSLEELDAVLADDVDSLLQGDFQAIDSVLDGVFEAQSAVVQHLEDDGEFEAYDPESDSFASAAPAYAEEAEAPGMIESITDPQQVKADGPPPAASPTMAAGEEATVADAVQDPTESAATAEAPVSDGEDASFQEAFDAVGAAADHDLQALDRDVDDLDVDALDESEFNAASTDELSDAPTVAGDAIRETIPADNPLITVLSLMNYPLRKVPAKARPVVDWVALSLIFWTPIVWAIVLFT
jgi:hypothetical protein